MGEDTMQEKYKFSFKKLVKMSVNQTQFSKEDSRSFIIIIYEFSPLF